MTAVLVTGATGYLGIEIARELARRGHEVHGLARAGSDREPLGDSVSRWHVGDLLEPESLVRAVGEFRLAAGSPDLALVHSAAVISYATADGELQRRANVEGTRALVAAARVEGVRRFVHVSSVVAVGVSDPPDAALDEDSPFDGARLGCDYMDTKRAAEETALGAAGDGLEVLAVNPGAVFGASPRPSNTSRFLATLAAHPALGLLAPPGSLAAVGVADVARGVALALERGLSGRRYLLVESEVLLSELYATVFGRLGRGRVLGTVPRAAWRLVVAVAGIVDRVVPLGFATPQALRLLGERFRVRGDRARTELGWTPRPFDAVLDETLEHVVAGR